MARAILIFLTWIGLVVSYPASTKLDLVPVLVSQDDTTKLEVGTTHTGRVELTLPLKITTKEELITWMTYAMRIMASRINITLASADAEHVPPERIEKLKNSSMAINHFLEKMNHTEKGVEMKMPEAHKITKTMATSGVKVNIAHSIG